MRPTNMAAPQNEKYVWKDIPGSSHDVLRRRILALPPGLRLLDLGAAGGHLGRAVRGHCSFLAGVEPHPPDSEAARKGYDDWRETDALHAGGWDTPFDVVVCADVIEHFADSEKLLGLVRGWLKRSGVLFVSLPNFANISVRLGLLFGQFRYAERGILDRTHLVHYTRATAGELLDATGFQVRAVEPTAMPYELALPHLSRPPWSGPTRAAASAFAQVWPTMFGYQFVFEAVKEEL
jgi:2-polyprenyl-3-methyl-5-hydroxy-6-metoxy-1,4-benzoquinol methylase